MEKLKLVTSNLNKLAEFKRLGLRDISVEKGLDLKEVQSDEINVIVYKALDAGKNRIVEDTSLEIEGADIGVNIRWQLDNLDKHIGKKSKWTVYLGHNDGEYIHVYKGLVDGTIVEAKEGSDGFGFDNVFKPTNSTMTLNELEHKGLKDDFSARKKAVLNFNNKKPIVSFYIKNIPVWKGEYQD